MPISLPFSEDYLCSYAEQFSLSELMCFSVVSKSISETLTGFYQRQYEARFIEPPKPIGFNYKRELARRAQRCAAVIADDWQLELTTPADLKNDTVFVLATLKKDASALQFASDALKANKAFVLMAVSLNGDVLEYASDVFKADREIVLAAVKGEFDLFSVWDWYDPHWFDEVLERFKDDKEVMLGAVGFAGFFIRAASIRLQSDRDIALAAVKLQYDAILHVNDKFLSDKEIILAAVNTTGRMFKYASDELKADTAVIMAALFDNELEQDIDENGCDTCFEVFKHAPEDAYENDKAFIMEAVAQDARILEYASITLQADKEVVLAAFESSLSWALAYVSDDLEIDASMMATIINNTNEEEHLDKLLAQCHCNRGAVLVAVQYDGCLLEHVSNALRADREVVLEAIKNNPDALEFCSSTLQDDPIFMREKAKVLSRDARLSQHTFLGHDAPAAETPSNISHHTHMV